MHAYFVRRRVANNCGPDIKMQECGCERDCHYTEFKLSAVIIIKRYMNQRRIDEVVTHFVNC